MGGDTWQYTYDNANHMLTAKETDGRLDAGAGDVYLSVFGNLLKEVYNNGSGATTIEHAYDMWNPANSLPEVWADQNGSNAVTTQYLRGDQANQLFANISSGGTLWILTDYQGSTRYETNGAGTSVTATISYDGWGTATVSSASAAGMYLYTGMMSDPASTGFDITPGRFYNPQTGTWTTQDPAGVVRREIATSIAMWGIHPPMPPTQVEWTQSPALAMAP